MNERLRQTISKTYDGSCWERITPLYWEDGTPLDLWLFNHDVELDGDTWRCYIIMRCEYSPDDLDVIEQTEDVFTAAWQL